MRALHRPVMEVRWEKSIYPSDRWLLERYRAAYKVGGKRNPVLVKGAPALTQMMVDSYGDYMEWAIDLSVGGGFTSAQRDVLKDYLVAAWKKNDKEQIKTIQDSLAKWDEVTHASTDKRKELHGALQPRVGAVARCHRRTQPLAVGHRQAGGETPRPGAGDGTRPARDGHVGTQGRDAER
jgi:hypothetical protein